MEGEKPAVPAKPRITVGRRLLRFFFGVVFLTFLAIGLLFTIIQLPPVQRWGIEQLTLFIQGKTGTKASVGAFSLTWKGEVMLEDVYIEDLDGDSLIVAERLGSMIIRDLQGLFMGRLAITDLYLGHASLHIKRYGDGSLNINRFLKTLFPPKGKKRRTFELDIRQIRLDDFHFSEVSLEDGRSLNVSSGKAFVEVKCVRFDPMDFELGKVTADGAVVHVTTGRPPSVRDNRPESPRPAVIRPFSFSFGSIALKNASFTLQNENRERGSSKPAGAIDFGDLQLTELDVDLERFSFNEELEFHGRLKGARLKESSGFVLEDMVAQRFAVNDTLALAEGLRIRTPNSSIGDTLYFRYQGFPSFLDFNDRVMMDCRFHGSRVVVRDLLFFAPALFKVPVFTDNQDVEVKLEGQLGSRVNNLRGRGLHLQVAEDISFKGDFGSRNLAVPGETSLNIRFEELSTSAAALKKWIPGFNMPSDFSKLGRIRFTGRFDGFLKDFVSYGDLKTDLGSASMDMRMNLRDGARKARYSGSLGLRRFDLGRWSGDPKFGSLTFHSRVRNGVGFRLEDLSAELDAMVDSVSYNGYTYRNLKIDGLVSRNEFKGQFDIRDEAADCFFEGTVQYGDTLPVFEFRSIVNRLDLQRMNFSENPMVFSGLLDLNMSGKTLNTISGTARAMRVVMDAGGGRSAKADSIALRVGQEGASRRSVEIESDLASLRLQGDFQLLELGDIFKSRFGKHFPELADRFRMRDENLKTLTSSDVTFRASDHRLDEFIRIFSDKLPLLDGAVAEGSIDLKREKIQLQVNMPGLELKGQEYFGIDLELQAAGAASRIRFRLDSLISGKTVVRNASIDSDRITDRYDFKLRIDDEYPFGTAIKGGLQIDSNGYHVSLANDSIVFTNQSWAISPENSMTLDSGFLSLRNMLFSSSKRIVELKDIRNKGLILHLVDVDLEEVNEYIDYDKIAFGGLVDVDLMVRDLFEFRNFAFQVTSKDFLMNGDHYGQFFLSAAMPTLKSPVEIDFELDNMGEGLTLSGKWDRQADTEKGGFADLRLRTRSFPVAFAEYFLGGGIVNTRGTFDADVRLFGPLRQLDAEGIIDVADMETVVDYLGVRYSVPKGRVVVKPGMFDATGVILRDPDNNTAFITGGLAHEHFKNLRLDCSIRSDRFMALNTKKQSSVYYGTGIGKIDVRFTGLLSAANIYVKAVTARGSNLSIPVSESTSPVRQQFVEFYDVGEREEGTGKTFKGIRGLEVTMDIELTEDALVQIIFDERAGDILRGYGRGNLRLEVPRSGSFRMFGSYAIERGDYLFTFQNLVNKSFAVERGGTIQWSGDPFDAQINIRTAYILPSTAVTNLIADYLVNGSPGLEQAARRPTEVHLLMNLTGKLLQPDITFDLAFPRLFGEVRSLVESEMQNLRRDPNKLNWQVFGLIVANNFLPPNLSRQQGTEYVATINTVSEMISNQFSRYLTALMAELVSDVGIISDIGMNVNYNFYQSQSITKIEEAFKDSEFQIRQRINFYDDRLSLNIEGSFINTRGIESSGGVLIGGDFRVEYALTEDRRLKMRVYQRTEPTVLGNNRYKVGAGLTYRKDFD